MSWLFGIKQPQVDVPGTPDDVAGSGGGGVVGGGGGGDRKDEKGGTESLYRFDSRALERAAEAAKRLESSKYANQAFELSKQAEITKQLEYKTAISQNEVAAKHSDIERARVIEEERRKSMQMQEENARRRAEYEHKLALQRQEEQLRREREAELEKLRLQEESVKKQEALRRQTMEREMEIRQKQDERRIAAEYSAKAQAERENKDVRLEMMRAEQAERRTTTIQALQTATSAVGQGLSYLLSDPKTLLATVGGVSLAALGIYSARQGTGVMGRFVEARLGKPSLVRDTSRVSLFWVVAHPFKFVKRLFSRQEEVMKGVVFAPKLERRLYDLALSTKNTQSNRGFFRNVLFWGVPGTGKTLYAKRLAMHSGLHYAIVTGGDVAPLGRDGPSAIHKLFDWANTSRRGVLLFIDEADAFLKKRSTEQISEDMRATLNAFLYRTGEQSKKMMLVVASNEPSHLDWALLDRLDEVVEFELPGEEERKRMLNYYFEQFVAIPASSGRFHRLKLDSFDWVPKLNEVAKRTQGLSGREISKLVVSWQHLL